MTFQCTSNPATPSNKNCFIPRTKHPNKSSTSSYTVQCSEESSDLLTGDTKHPLHKIWHNKDEQDKTQLYICSKGQRSLFWWCQSSHFGLRRKSVGEKSKRGHLCSLWTTIVEQKCGLTTPAISYLQHSQRAPDISTPIHSLCHVTSLAHIMLGRSNVSQWFNLSGPVMAITAFFTPQLTSQLTWWTGV